MPRICEHELHASGGPVLLGAGKHLLDGTVYRLPVRVPGSATILEFCGKLYTVGHCSVAGRRPMQGWGCPGPADLKQLAGETGNLKRKVGGTTREPVISAVKRSSGTCEGNLVI